VPLTACTFGFVSPARRLPLYPTGPRRDAPFTTQQVQPSGAPTYLRRGFAADPARWDASSLPEYLSEADKNIFVCIMLETAEAVENIEEICAVPGLDSVRPPACN